MKYFAMLTLILAASLGPQNSKAADPAYYDQICPNASPAIEHYSTIVRINGTLVADAVSAADAASGAYDACGDRYRSAGDAEHMHYASVGAAKYHFAAGRLLRLGNHFDEARVAFQTALLDVTDTLTWGTANAPSAYRPAAVEVRDASSAEIAKLPTAASATTAPTAIVPASAAPASAAP